MRKLMIAGAAAFAVAATTVSADAQERVLTGAAIGAGTGAIIAGPPGALAGGIIGAVVGGPRLPRRYAKECWYDKYGARHCRTY